MRNPSLHITQDKFTQVFYKLLTKYNIKLKHKERLVEDLFVACSTHSANHRSLSITNQKLLTKTEKASKTPVSNAAMFANLLLLTRQKLKHKGVVPIRVGSAEWLQLKNIVNLADQFNAEFGIDQKEGYVAYLELALNKLQRFSLNKIPNLHSSICSEYEALSKLELDKTPKETQEAYEAYRTMVSQKTGIPNLDYEKYPEKYVVFMEVKKICEKLGVSYKTYIAAQFSGLGFRDQVPDPLQLIGDKAMIRMQKYCFENNINIGKSTTKIKWDKIRED